MRQGLEHAQGPVAEVEAVDVARTAARRVPGRERDRPQEHALARTAGAVDREVAFLVGVERHHRLGLIVRVVGHAERQLVVAAGRGQGSEVIDRAQLGQPRDAGDRQLSRLGRDPDGRHETLDVGRPRVVVVGPPRAVAVRLVDRQLPHRSEPVGQRLDPHLRRPGRVGGPATGIGGLERGEPPGPALGHGPARQGRVEVGGRGRADHVRAVVLVGHPQGQAQVGVRPQVVLDDASRALGRKDQVQAQGAATLGDVDDALDELRHLLDQGGELVDDDDQARRGVDLTTALELDEVLGVVLGQEVLAVAQLGGQRGQRSPDQVRREVGHQTDGVRQLHTVAKRRPALVVDEQEGDPLRGVRGRHTEDPSLQELGLARTRGATDQSVRAVRAQVERERPLGRLADDRPQVAGLSVGGLRGERAGEDGPALSPALDHGLLGSGQLGAGQRQQGHRPRQIALVVDGCPGVLDRRQGTGCDQRLLHAGDVDLDRRDDPAVLDIAGTTLVAVDLEEDPAGRRQLGRRGSEPHHGDSVKPAPLGELDQPAALRRGIVLDQDEHSRSGAFLVLDQVLELGQQRRTGGCRAGQMTGLDRAVRGRRVRHPLEPVPVTCGGGRGEGRHDQLSR